MPVKYDFIKIFGYFALAISLYLISIQSSNNGHIWNDVIGGIETGFFTEKINFEFPILTQDTKFLKIGIKPVGSSFQKFRVYEIIVT